MSFLVLPAGIPDFSRVVISFWFRVPQGTIEAARAAYQPDADPAPPFNGIIPLLTFGQRVKRKGFQGLNMPMQQHRTHHFTWRHPQCAYVEVPPSGTFTSYALQWVFTGEEFDVDPSYIGVDVTSPDGTAALTVNVQMADGGTLDGGKWSYAETVNRPIDLNSYDRANRLYDPYGTPLCSNYPPVDETGHLLPLETVTTIITVKSGAPVVIGNTPDSFRNLPLEWNEEEPSPPCVHAVTPDHWHHVLLSLDLTKPCITQGSWVHAPGDRPDSPRVDSACRMWLAFDDENHTNEALSFMWPPDYGDANGLLSRQAYAQYTDVLYFYGDKAANDLVGHWNVTQYVGYAAATCNYQPGPVPSNGHPMGLPSTDQFIDNVRNVMMAELQIFPGVTLDTGIEANRRAFVDEEGTPVLPTGTDEEPAPAEKLLGKRPEILLHRTGNWQQGRNTGSLGQDDEGNEIREGQFKPTGRIDPYKPDPSLHGPQSPTPPVRLTKKRVPAPV